MSQASTSTTSQARPEANSLPSKVGEIGYVPPLSPEMRQVSPSDDVQLPARHPADRENEETSNPASQNPTSNTESSATSVTKKTWIDRFSWKGVSLFTTLRIILIFVFLGAVGAGWAITVKRVVADTDKDIPLDENSDNGQPRLKQSISSVVFVHVSFTIVVLFLLLFLERAFFHARAERYLYKHGMPRSASNVASMGIAPWNRPPLPTYAALLAESGVRTGDVEDNIIAIPPPPAYGNTRGSVLLLSGFLRDSLVRPASHQSASPTVPPINIRSPEAEIEEGRKSRPISYDASEEVDNAKRARELEFALARLESRRD